MKGEVGAKLREGQTLRNAATIDAETKVISTERQGQGSKEEIKVKAEVKVYENEREAEVAKAKSELAKKKAVWSKEAQVAEVEPAKAVALRDAELQGEVEKMNAMTRTEKLKAEFLSKAHVDYETKAMSTFDLQFYFIFSLLIFIKNELYILASLVIVLTTKVQEANWELYKKQKAADAVLYEKEKEAKTQKKCRRHHFIPVKKPLMENYMQSKKKLKD